MENASDFILRLCIQVPPFLLAIVFHEYAHAFVAHRFGDDTAKMAGRLTFNPKPHLDLIGTIIFPLIGALIGGIMFGWARPVPVDPRRFRTVRKGIFWVSFAGPLANIILAIFSAFVFAFMLAKIPQDFFLFSPLVGMLKNAVMINIVLAVFNLIPFPPLDGSKMVSSFLSYQSMIKYEGLARFSLLFFIVLMYTGALRIVLMPAFGFGEGLINLFYRMWI